MIQWLMFHKTLLIMAIKDYFDFAHAAFVFQLKPRLVVFFNFKALYRGFGFAYSQYKWHKATFFMTQSETHQYLMDILDGVYIAPGKNYAKWQEGIL